MALAQELASFNIDSIKTSLKGAVKTIKVDAKIDLDIHVATGLTDAVAAAQKIIEKADPKQLEAAVRTMLEELQQLAALPEIHTVVEVSSSFERIAAMLRLVAERAGVDPDAIVEQISEGTGLQQVIADLVKRFVDSMPAKLPDEIRVPIEGLQKFVSGDPADAAELADVLARFLVGVDLHSLGEPSLSINASASLLASAGGDFGPIAAHITALTANVRAITLQLRAAQPDVPSIVLAILAVSDGLDLLFDELRPAMARLTAAFNGIDIAPIVARVEAALRPIVALVPNLTFDLMRTTVAPLRALGSGIDSLTAQQLDALFADVEARLRHALQTSALGEATRLLDLYRDLAIERLRAIGIGRLRNEVVSALSAVEARINRFGFQAADAFAAQIDALGKGIGSLDVKPIRDAVAAVKAKIKQIEDPMPINQLNTDLRLKIKDVQEL